MNEFADNNWAHQVLLSMQELGITIGKSDLKDFAVDADQLLLKLVHTGYLHRLPGRQGEGQPRYFLSDKGKNYLRHVEILQEISKAVSR